MRNTEAPSGWLAPNSMGDKWQRHQLQMWLCFCFGMAPLHTPPELPPAFTEPLVQLQQNACGRCISLSHLWSPLPVLRESLPHQSVMTPTLLVLRGCCWKLWSALLSGFLTLPETTKSFFFFLIHIENSFLPQYIISNQFSQNHPLPQFIFQRQDLKT